MSSNSPDFAIVPAEVTDAGKYVQMVADSLINGLRSLDVDIERLFDSWQGYLADDYATAWANTKDGAATVLESLSAMASLLGVTSATLSGQDKARAGATNSLHLDLPDL